MKEKIIEFILKEYSVQAEYPFKDETAVFRNARNKKWFGIIMKIPKNRLGINSDKIIDVINLKNYPADVCTLRNLDGVYPAYHMNKENWFTVILDDKIPLGMLIDLIDQSYAIINLKTKSK